ncbi:MAG: hypothetical protein JOZ73_05360 [Solirubrobacterales bacterium]|nr:hypothetical protein [Solirubrobacterales bacterium]
MGTRVFSFFRSNAVALLALFVALGGTGYAAAKINGKNIKNGTITAKKLKKHTLTGKQINLNQLGKVPSASNADNANTLGGASASNYLKGGCGPGKVNGYASVRSASSIPTTYTPSATFLPNTFNCSGQPVQVRRSGTGIYFIKFPGNPSTVGFANLIYCPPGFICLVTPENDASVNYEPTGADAGSFAVRIQQSGSTTLEDSDFDIMTP